ncbi:MAG: DEAD/DEAH box helicase, partial [Spirochaetes bacterium]|nr:DEAD/DEAH box helicase [Spirochaetota bacterium]
MHSFLSLGLNPEIARALDSFGFTQPTEIQSLSASAILGAKDAYISSATGSGKTFAYLAPILSMLDPASNETGAIIIAPTHDLAAQLFRETNRLVAASGLGFRTAQALGSISLQRQREQLQTRPHVIIGSAGRLRDLVESRYIDIRQCRYVVMDEGDRLFEKEVVEISSDLLNRLPESCSRVLVSATIPEKIVGRTAAWFRDPQKLFLDSSESLRSTIEHWCFHAPSRKKSDFLRRFEVAVKPERCLLFVSSNAMLHSVAEKLEHFGIQYAELKATQAGNERKSALHMFADGEVRWLLTTDLGARGLDIADISHVISYDLPEEPSIYVHRAGRTGRAGQHGISVAITDMVELKRASKIAVRYNFPFICKILDSGHVY